MKNKFFALILILSVLQSCDLLGELLEGKTEYISKSQLYIGDLTLFLSKNKMIEYLGEPDSTSGNQLFFYDGLKILLDAHSGIWDVICTNPKYQTSDGIKVGDSREKVINTYGKTTSFNNNDSETIIYSYYPVFDRTLPLCLKFEIMNEKVEKIQLWFHYE